MKNTVVITIWAGMAAVTMCLPPQLPAQNVVAPPPNDSTGPYKLHLSDSLEITFPFAPAYNQTTEVQPDGLISLKEAAPVHAQGVTIQELALQVAADYRGILRDPKVSIVLKDYQKPSYYASGEVGKPGRYELRAQTSLLQALSEAGGLMNERANKKQVVLFRPQANGTYSTQVIDVKTLLKPSGRDVEDYAIYPGDIVYVPQNKFSKVVRFIPTANMSAYVAP